MSRGKITITCDVCGKEVVTERDKENAGDAFTYMKISYYDRMKVAYTNVLNGGEYFDVCFDCFPNPEASPKTENGNGPVKQSVFQKLFMLGKRK